MPRCAMALTHKWIEVRNFDLKSAGCQTHVMGSLCHPYAGGGGTGTPLVAISESQNLYGRLYGRLHRSL